MIEEPSKLEALCGNADGNCYGIDASMKNLAGMNFNDVDLRAANLLKANLVNASFVNAKLCGANLEGAILTGANFYRASMVGANLSKSTLDHARFGWAFAKYVNFQDAIITNASLERSWLSGSDFRRSIFIGSTMNRKTYLWRARLEGADLSDVDGVTKVIIENSASWDKHTVFPEGLLDALELKSREYKGLSPEEEKYIKVQQLLCNRNE